MDSAEWKKIDSFWWQKIFIPSSGQPKITYHYKTKKCSPCKVIELDTRISKRLTGFSLIEKDLRDTKLIYDEYLKLTHDKKGSKILLKALLRAVIITYAKCFVKADGRRIKLEQKNISEKNKETHEHLFNMRNEYVAHAGEGFEQAYMVLVVPPYRKYSIGKNVSSGLLTEILQPITSGYIESDIRPLLNEVHNYVLDKIEKINSKFNKDFLLISPDCIYEFLRGKKGRSKLTDDDLLSLKNKS